MRKAYMESIFIALFLYLLINGSQDRDGLEMDFTATIIIFRLAPVLTVFNSLSIDDFKLKDIGTIIRSLEQKIWTASGSWKNRVFFLKLLYNTAEKQKSGVSPKNLINLLQIVKLFFSYHIYLP